VVSIVVGRLVVVVLPCPLSLLPSSSSLSPCPLALVPCSSSLVVYTQMVDAQVVGRLAVVVSSCTSSLSPSLSPCSSSLVVDAQGGDAQVAGAGRLVVPVAGRLLVVPTVLVRLGVPVAGRLLVVPTVLDRLLVASEVMGTLLVVPAVLDRLVVASEVMGTLLVISAVVGTLVVSQGVAVTSARATPPCLCHPVPPTRTNMATIKSKTTAVLIHCASGRRRRFSGIADSLSKLNMVSFWRRRTESPGGIAPSRPCSLAQDWPFRPWITLSMARECRSTRLWVVRLVARWSVLTRWPAPAISSMVRNSR
jgi:hypothetical protein